MSYTEPPGEDPYDLHVADAEAVLDMTEADIRRVAGALGVSVAEYRRRREQKIERLRQVNTDDLTPDQYRRLFRQDPPR